jgi:hypothetical protein
MTKFKIGDKVRVKTNLIPDNYYVGNDGRCNIYCNGDMVKLGGETLVIVSLTSKNNYNLNKTEYNWCDEMLEDVTSKGKKVKETPIIKHVVIQDSCGNFLGIKNSEKEAIVFAKSYNKENITIYKMVEVAKVTTERRVSKVKTSKKNGRSK